MTKTNGSKTAFVVFLVCAASAIEAQAQTFTTLVNFDGKNGANPLYMSLAQGTDGNFYGTTKTGGTNNCSGGLGCGTVFKITSSGTLTTIYTFCSQTGCTDGYFPYAGLVLGDGNFYGTTYTGGYTICGNIREPCGTVYKITAEGALTTLLDFDGSGGEQPIGRLIQGTDGNFYGPTIDGGTFGRGTVFRMTPQGTLTAIHSFNGADGSQPLAGVIQASDGALYGTTSLGGASGGGTVFRITRSGKLTTLFSFCANCPDGDYPRADLVQGIDGDLYGTTAGGESKDYGTVFAMTLAGKLKTLHRFSGTDGSYPSAALVQATDGNFYGATAEGGDLECNAPNGGCGTLFGMTPQGTLTTLHVFELTDGLGPQGALLQSTDGRLYGTTVSGGSSNEGTVFSLDMNLGPFIAFVRAAGRVGQTGGILGQGFTGTTAVLLNGTPATFTVVSDTFIKATVPTGATTGYVTVATPSGVLKSNVPFRVIQ
jgi:uncharacterized repeat protein (TIGR03803 family)